MSRITSPGRGSGAPLVVGLGLALLGAKGDLVVARVGAERVTVADAERRWAELPGFQRRALARDPRGGVRGFVEDVLVHELVLGAEAKARKLDQTDRGRARVSALLGDALLEAVAAEVSTQRPVTPEEVRAYYEANRARFETPAALRLWRILVTDEQVAAQIVTAARAVDGPAKWSELARKHSKDKATAMRKGDLGFVQADGRTAVPTVAVAPALYAAAEKVRDGEVVPEPVPEGKYLAVVWRRGSRAGVTRSLAEVAPQIEQALARSRREQAVATLLADLRQRHVRDVDLSALEELGALPMPEVRQLPPPVLSARPAAQGPLPQPGPRGQR